MDIMQHQYWRVAGCFLLGIPWVWYKKYLCQTIHHLLWPTNAILENQTYELHVLDY